MEQTCSICLETITIDQHGCELVCRHVFHTSCITYWLLSQSNCPLCREVVQRCNHFTGSSDEPFENYHAFILPEVCRRLYQEKKQAEEMAERMTLAREWTDTSSLVAPRMLVPNHRNVLNHRTIMINGARRTVSASHQIVPTTRATTSPSRILFFEI